MIYNYNLYHIISTIICIIAIHNEDLRKYIFQIFNHILSIINAYEQHTHMEMPSSVYNYVS